MFLILPSSKMLLLNVVALFSLRIWEALLKMMSLASGNPVIQEDQILIDAKGSAFSSYELFISL